MATNAGGGHYRPPLHSTNVGRKCVVCGSTKHEVHLKPLLLKGVALHNFANNYFRFKPHRIQTFLAKLRYTINPYGCIEHFNGPLDPFRPPRPPQPRGTYSNVGKRTVYNLLKEGEEPPSIAKITERKPSPPPEERKETRTQKEVNDAIMALLQEATAAMEHQDHRRRSLKKFTRRFAGYVDFDDDQAATGDRKKKRLLRARTPRKKRVADGNEADSDGSTVDVDVEADDTERQESSGMEENDGDMLSMDKPQSSSYGMYRQKPTVVMPRVRRPVKPYRISTPQMPQTPVMDRKPLVPKRLTLNSATSKNYQRPSWVEPNPGQHTLASVLHSFWNESGPASGGDYGYMRQQQHKGPARRTVLTGRRAELPPRLSNESAPAQRRRLQMQMTSSTRQQPRSSRFMPSARLYNVILSPSRLDIGSEETVKTSTTVQQEESKMASPVPSSGSSSSETEGDVEVDVCGLSLSGHSPAAVRHDEMDGVVEERDEEARTRTISTALTTTSEELESSDSEIDVETVDDTLEKSLKKKAQRVVEAAVAVTVEPATPPAPRPDRRKQRLSQYADDGPPLQRITPAKKKFVALPVVKPPTKLLTFGEDSLKEALQKEARAATGLPIRIEDEKSAAAPKPKPKFPRFRAKLLPRLRPLCAAAVKGGQPKPPSDWSRLEKIMQQKLIEHKEKQAAEKRKAVMISDDPPPELEDARGNDELIDSLAKGFAKKFGLSINATPKAKVLRVRFHKKTEEAEAKKKKVLARRTLPQGMDQKEEDVWKMNGLSLAAKERDQKRHSLAGVKMVLRKPVHPPLVIDKAEVVELMDNQHPPPPIPIVCVPKWEQIQARRQMYEQLRHDELLRTGVIFDQIREEWQVETSSRPKGRKEDVEDAGRSAVSLCASSADEIYINAGEEKAVDIPLQGSKRFSEPIFSTPVPLSRNKPLVNEQKAPRQVGHPSLVIDKSEVLQLMEKLKGKDHEAPEEDYAPLLQMVRAEREKKRGRRASKVQEEETAVKQTTVEKAKPPRKMNKIFSVVMSDIENDDEEMLQVEEVVEEEEEVEGEEQEEEEKGNEEEEEQQEQEEEAEVEDDVEDEEEEEEEVDERDDEWKATAAAKRKMQEEKIEEESDTRRKSHRLREKRASGRKWNPIWMKSDDEEEAPILAATPVKVSKKPNVSPPAPAAAAAVDDDERPAELEKEKTVTPVKKKRGRPRKNPEGPPPKKKREERKKMTAVEKELLSRTFPSMDVDDDDVVEERPRIEEERMEDETAVGEEMDVDDDDDEGPAPLEMQEPKPEGDGPVLSGAKRRPMSWSWKQRLGAEAAQHETLGRLCRLCTTSKRKYWVANDSLALMDHARTHCVETLMCPSNNCTYMNTMRSRISQHVTYVHKKWGMPIDLAEVYPALRTSLSLRLRQCFPDEPNLSVCLICRVAVRRDPDHHRWHAQSHLKTRVFECSRDICSIKFASEQECVEHIRNTKCHGSVVNGMTDEMEAEVTVLVDRCFGAGQLLSVPNARKENVPPRAADGEALCETVSPSTSMPSLVKMETEKDVEVEEEVVEVIEVLEVEDVAVETMS